MELVLSSINQPSYSKDTFRMDSSKDKDWKFIPMGHFFLETIQATRKMERVGSNGPMAKFMMVNG